MKRSVRRDTMRVMFATCLLVFAFTMIPTASAQQLCTDQTSIPPFTRYCTPPDWNGDLVIYAHGFVPFGLPLQIPDDSVGGISIQNAVLGMGYAYATTSYSSNGLVIPQGVKDIIGLLSYVKSKINLDSGHVFLVGASEGGLVATLAVEQHPNLFDGGLSVSGPIGDFRKQIDYMGDFLVVFNYFFPGVLPGCTPEGISPAVVAGWNPTYVNAILGAIAANPSATKQLLRVTQAPIDTSDPTSIPETILGILTYNIFATDNAIAVLGGVPFDNTRRLYLGSNNDFRLNRLIQRVSASPVAIQEIQDHYQTSGYLRRPMISIHNTADPIVPFWHEPLYSWKTILQRSARFHLGIPVFRYGHVNFTFDELQAAFGAMVFGATAQDLFAQILPALRSAVAQPPQ